MFRNDRLIRTTPSVAYGQKTRGIFLFTILIPYFCIADTICFHESDQRSETVMDLALAVFKQQHLNSVTIFKEQSSADLKLFRKSLAHIPTSFISPTTLWRLDDTFSRIGVLVDLRNCSAAKAIFQQGALRSYFNSSYRWLVVTDSSQETAGLFQRIDLRLDSSITAALALKDSYHLSDLYKLPGSDQILQRPVGQFRGDRITEWVDAENAPFRSMVHRTVATGIHVEESASLKPMSDVLKFLNLLRGHPLIPAQYFSMKDYHLYRDLCDIYNITMQPYLYTQTGFPDENGVLNGLLGAIQKHEIEIAANKFLISKFRMTAGDYHNPCESLNMDVVYYVGTSLETPGALFQPFALSLWIGIAVACTLLFLSLCYAGRWEMRSNDTKVDLSATSTFLFIFGIFNGQGNISEVRCHSTRIVTIVGLTMGFLVASAYNAKIVGSLLSTPAPDLRNKMDFMASPLKLAVENYYGISHVIFGEKMDASKRILYNKKVAPPKGRGFCSVPECFPGVLARQWAMFGQVNNIQLEIAKATPSQVCRLAWIHDIDNETRVLCSLTSKKSDIKNLVSRGYLLLRERGFYEREKLRHYAARIPCLPEHRHQLAPVKIQIVLGAVFTVLGGMVAAVLILAMELLHR